jgi:hypothetical protein
VDDLTGRVVIVPQADNAQGAALARVMCEAGASAVLIGDEFTRLGAVAAEIHGETGSPIVIFAGNITRDEERAVLTEMVSELFPN